jgi:hypothetical protein
MREIADIQPPSPHVQPAPAVQKTPAAQFHIYRARPRPKAQDLQPAKTARIHVEILHHFAEAKASIWLDDQILLDENLHVDDQRHPMLRSLEMNQTSNFDVSSGKHQVQVRVVAPDNTYDQSETVDAELAPGSKHVLHVNCDKRKMLVVLR